MHPSESPPPEKANEEGSYTTSAPEDNVYWDGDVVAKGEIVEHVDGEEKEYVRYPASNRHSRGLQEPWWVGRGDLIGQREEEGDEELNKGYEEP